MFETTEAGDDRSPVGYTGSIVPVDPETLSDPQLRDALGEFERLIALAQAGQYQVLAEMAERTEPADTPNSTGIPGPIEEHDPLKYLVDELTLELALSKRAASNRSTWR